MARARSGGGGLGIALVVFGVFFVISLVLAILFYTKIEQAELAEKEARQDLAQVISSRDTEAAKQATDEKAEGDTVVAKLLDTIRRQKTVITALRDDVTTKEQLAATRQGDKERLQTQLADAQRLQKEAQDRLKVVEDDLTAQLQAARKAQIDAETRKEGYATELTAKIQQLEAELAAFREGRGDAITSRDASLEEANKSLAQAQAQIRRLEQELSDVREQVRIDAVKVDAEVVGLLQEGQAVVLNIGSSANVPLGLTFQIFGADDVIKLEDSSNELNGKAVVEVYSTKAGTCEARVVSKAPRAVIREGDSAVNVVYSPNTTHTFQVYGRFDIENTGDEAVDDRERIVSLIKQWGGEVAKPLEDKGAETRLSHDLSFLVLGEEPEYPAELDQDQVPDPDVVKRRREQLQRYETFQTIKKQAQDMSIPVLNETRLLYLTGYYSK